MRKIREDRMLISCAEDSVNHCLKVPHDVLFRGDKRIRVRNIPPESCLKRNKTTTSRFSYSSACSFLILRALTDSHDRLPSKNDPYTSFCSSQPHIQSDRPLQSSGCRRSYLCFLHAPTPAVLQPYHLDRRSPTPIQRKLEPWQPSWASELGRKVIPV